MQTEQLQNFNERLSQWVANQGFWFQIRYSMSTKGMSGRAMFHLLRLGFRILVFLLVLAAGTWVYLVKRTDSERFKEAFRKELESGLSASELAMRGLNRMQGQLEIARFASQGGDGTFFSSMEVRNLRCKMGLIDGLVGIWKPGTIAISKVDIDLRAGADDKASAAKQSASIFHKASGIEITSLEVADTNLRWGYSERTRGSIENSTLKMQRTNTGWHMIFKGGTFSQNWLSKLDIINLVVDSDGDGLFFEKAEFKKNAGSVTITGLKLAGGERPEVSGVAKIRNLELDEILPSALWSFVEGTISGDFRVFGSTNSSDGIGFQGQVVLDGKDTITLRERLHVLKALSVVDYSRNYHRIDFREGSFLMKTTRGGLELSELKLKSEDLFTLEGKFNVRLPTDQEVQAAVAKGTGAENSPIFSNEDEANAAHEALPKEESAFTLRKAAEAQRIKEGTENVENLSLFDRLGISLEMRRLQSQASERMSRMLQYEGAVRITIPGDAFERAKHLQQAYPVDPTTGRVSLRVPLEGSLYELTLKQAEDIYQLGQR